MFTPRSVIIADAHDIYVIGIESVIAESEGFTVRGGVRSAKALYRLMEETPADLLILGTTLQDDSLGSIMDIVKGRHPDVKVVLIALSNDLGHIQQALHLGVDAYLLRSVEPEELLQSLDRVAAGEKYFSPDVQLTIGDKVNQLLQERKILRPMMEITKREKEVLNLIVDGYTNQEIGELLAISTRTVETHRANLMHKLQVRNTAGLVKMAYVLDNGV